MINLNDTELYLLIFLVLGCSIGNAVYCICCNNDKNRVQPVDIL